MVIWLQFIASAFLIVVSGTVLVRYADMLGDRFHLSKAWLGIIVLGLATSLPEAAASISAILSVGSADMAVGNMLGSNNINLMIVVVLDLLYRRGSITDAIRTRRSHMLSALCAILLTVVVLGEITIGAPAVGHVSAGTVLLLIMYTFCIRMLSRVRNADTDEPVARPAPATAQRIYIGLAVSVVLVFAGAQWLVTVADTIARSTGLGQTFIGSIFLAFITSLPEITVAVAALRLGSLDMAFGNIFGSNMVNIFIIAICALCYTAAPILSVVSHTHMVTAALGIVLTGIVILGVRHQKKKQFFGLGWDTIAMTVCFAGGVGLLYQLR